MPVKGDDFDSIIADAVIEHLQNTVGTFTAEGLAHPGATTASIAGIVTREKIESNGRLAFQPVFSFKTGTIIDPVSTLVLTPKRGDQMTIDSQDYTVQEMEVESADMTRLVLEVKLT